MSFLRSLALAALALSLVACEKKEEPPKVDETPEVKEETAKPVEEKPTEGKIAEGVKLTAEGTKFDPPIKPEELPDGAFYCDMGTVHWAASSEPADGKCPLCGMKLKTRKP